MSRVMAMNLSSDRPRFAHALLLMWVCLSLLAACSSLQVDQGSGVSSGNGGTGGASTTSGAGGIDLSASATASTGSGAGDAGPYCVSAPYETDIVLILPDGQVPCGGSNGNQDLTGVVVDSGSPAEIMIDTCVPGTGCAPSIVRLTLTSPGLTVSVPPGSFARLQYSSFYNFTCASVVMVTEADSFGGMVDPNAKGRVWVIVSADQPIQ